MCAVCVCGGGGGGGGASFPGRSLGTKLPTPMQHLLLFYEGNFTLHSIICCACVILHHN